MSNPFRTSLSEQAAGQAELERQRQARPSQRVTQTDWDARWVAAAAWCERHVPELVDNRGVTCGFAVGSALRLKSELGRTPKPGEVRVRRASWMRQLDLGDAV